MTSFLRAHTRVIAFSLVALCAFWLTPSWREVGPFLFLLLFAIFVTFAASPLFWIRCVVDLGQRVIPGKPRRAWLWVITDPTLRGVLIEGVWSVWLVGSLVGFALVMVFWAADGATRTAAWGYRRAAAAGHAATPKPKSIAQPSPARRRFLEQTAIAASATPFVAAAYGLVVGRLDVEVTRQRIRLAHLPKAFEGFRIAQLSNIHISPFMPADEIRRCVTISNGLQPDLVVLTGDYTDTEDSITRLFADFRGSKAW